MHFPRRRSWARTLPVWLAAAALSWSCVPEFTDTELPSDVVIVRSVLTTLADTQWLELEYGMLAGGDDQVAEPISGAEVEVSYVNVAVAFSGVEPGRYRALFRPTSGTTYELLVRAPGEKDIRGITTVPDPPVIIDPAGETFEITDGSSFLPITWTKGRADSIQLTYVFHRPPQPSSTFTGTTTASSARFFVGSGCGATCCGTATAVVANPDASLLHYMLLPAGTPSLLDGAEGVFGSLAGDTLLVTFPGDSLC